MDGRRDADVASAAASLAAGDTAGAMAARTGSEDDAIAAGSIGPRVAPCIGCTEQLEWVTQHPAVMVIYRLNRITASDIT